MCCSSSLVQTRLTLNEGSRCAIRLRLRMEWRSRAVDRSNLKTFIPIPGPHKSLRCAVLRSMTGPMCCSGCLVHRSLTEDSNVLLEFSSSDEVDSEWGEQVCDPPPLEDGMKEPSCWQIKLEGFYTGPHKSLGCAVLRSTTGPMCCSGCLVHRSLTEDSNVLLEFSSSDEVDSEWGEQVCDSPSLDDRMKAPSCWQIKLDGFYTNIRSPPVARVCGPPLDDGRPICCSGCLVHRSLTEDSNVLLELSSSEEVDSEWGEQVCDPPPLDDGVKEPLSPPVDRSARCSWHLKAFIPPVAVPRTLSICNRVDLCAYV